MKHSDLIDRLGGVNAVAKLMGVSAPSVSAWKKQGIPMDKLIRLAVIAEGKSIVSRKDLLPDCWPQIWPELVEKSGVCECKKLVSSAQSSDADFSSSPDGLGDFFNPALCELCRKRPSMSASTGERN